LEAPTLGKNYYYHQENRDGVSRLRIDPDLIGGF